MQESTICKTLKACGLCQQKIVLEANQSSELLRSQYVTGFAKRGLPHTSNAMNVEDHNVVFK